jgi:very-short-patch-repair endonuclease
MNSNIIPEIVIERFLKNESVQSISLDLGCARSTINLILEKNGFQKRTQAESAKLRYVDTTPEYRQEITRMAHDTIRGRKRDWQDRCTRAKGVEQKQNLSDLEKRFRDYFIKNGIDVRTLFPFGAFNIDIAVPEHCIAIEVHGGNFHSTKSHQAKDFNKLRYLSRYGWTVFYVLEDDFKVRTKLDKIVSFIKFLSGNPTITTQ